MTAEIDTSGDCRLYGKISAKWDIPPAAARSAINRIEALLADPRTKTRDVVRLLAALEGLESILIRAALADATIADSAAQQAQIRDLQNQIADRPQESQPLRILIDDSAELRSATDAMAAPNAGVARGEEHADDVRSA